MAKSDWNPMQQLTLLWLSRNIENQIRAPIWCSSLFPDLDESLYTFATHIWPYEAPEDLITLVLRSCDRRARRGRGTYDFCKPAIMTAQSISWFVNWYTTLSRTEWYTQKKTNLPKTLRKRTQCL
jgi:hypothetical protein